MLEPLRQRLARHAPERLNWPEFKAAAVLVLLLLSPTGAELLLTIRSSRLSHHAGQIAFPGGRLEPGESVEEAALRECAEEVGLRLPPQAVWGRLSDHPSPAGYIVTPVVAAAPATSNYRLCNGEVAEVFTIPLATLLALAPRTETRTWQGQPRTIHFFETGGRLIWGLTANIVAELLMLARSELSHTPGRPPAVLG
ncbi:MAG: CoA pyrophosphatase [Truepera sp.]|nr:CoA pyrophosphatase [Truepera sp.]